MVNKKQISRDAQKIDSVSASRKFYRKPYLEELGDLRTLTLGGSPGTGDTGGTGGYEAPMGFSGGPLLPPEY